MEIILMLLMFILIVLNLINIYYLYFILKNIDKSTVDKKADTEDNIKARRKGNIAKVDFNNLMTGRKDPYDYFKNSRGLYEPVTGKKGIDLNTIRKEEV